MIEGIAFTDIGLSGLVVIIVLSILAGRLVPRRSLEDMREDRDAWRATTQQQTVQLEKLLTHAETTTAILRALPHPADAHQVEGVDP